MHKNRRGIRVMAGVLGMALVLGMTPAAAGMAAEDKEQTTEGSGTAGGSAGETTGSGSGESFGGDYIDGSASDLSISNVSISDVKAGEDASVSFTVTGATNTKKKYSVDVIEAIYPNVDSASGFVKNNETSRVTTGTGNTLNASYTFKTKDTAETGYYPVAFSVVYTRRSTDGKTNWDNEYVVTKEFSVKVTGKKVTEPTATPDISAEDSDIYLQVNNSPAGTYGQKCKVAFVAKSSKYDIMSVAPVVDNDFPFESNSDAYKVTRSAGTKSLNCNYQFVVKNNVTTGYMPMAFEITYKKGQDTVKTKKTVNISVIGKKEKKDEPNKDKKKSTPRVMVIGYTTDKNEIHPNGEFELDLKIKNNASTTVKNVKFTLSTANGEFLPVSGASTAYLDSIAAKGVVTLSFNMKASASLGAKSYPITVKSEYEDSDTNPYDATDSVSIPIILKDRISLSDLEPAYLSMGEEADVSFSINNMGGASLNNVRVKCQGKGISSKESYIGNIGAGSTQYADVTVTGTEVTDEEKGGTMNVVITYENAAGVEKVYKEEAEVYVSEAMDEDAAFDEDMMMDEAAQKSGFPIIPVVIGVGVVLVVIIIIVRVRKKKKRLQLEQELMEDELS